MAKKVQIQEFNIEVPTTVNGNGEMLSAIAITGAAGCGKSSLARLLHRLLSSNDSQSRLMWIDVSQIIAWCMRFDTPLAQEVKSEKPSMDRGYLLKDEYLIPTFQTWFNDQLANHPQLETLIIVGLPRSWEQNELLNLFGRFRLINQVVSRDVSDASIRARWEKTPAHLRRDDDHGGDTVIQTRWHEHVHVSLPAIQSLGGMVLELNRKHSLPIRIERCLKDLRSMGTGSPVRKDDLNRAIGRFMTDPHPIHEEIEKIETEGRQLRRQFSNVEIAWSKFTPIISAPAALPPVSAN